MAKDKTKKSIEIAIAWCLAWGSEREPKITPDALNQMRNAMLGDRKIPDPVQEYVEQAKKLDTLPYPQKLDELKAIADENPRLWNSKIGLVYGGATKIKQYVFEASNLQDVRGASALLDRINLVDLPAFFHGELSDRFERCQQLPDYCQQVRANWLDRDENYPGLSDALIPELVIYSTGGNILAFCPAAFVDVLADAIEKRYTQETLTANSCAVGDTFRFLELQFGLLKDPIEKTNWLEWYRQNASQNLVKAYFGKPESDLTAQFERRKSFNELVGKLVTHFNQRRSGHDNPEENRPSRRYPPMFETHPYVRRDENEKRSSVRRIEDTRNRTGLPAQPWFSDPLARKRIAGQKAKRDRENTNWYQPEDWLNWEPGEFDSWINKFESSLKQDSRYRNHPHYQNLEDDRKEARSLREIGNVSKPQGFVAYIYADGNNMGGHIQKIKTPQAYASFSQTVFEATEQSVYRALSQHLEPRKLEGLGDPDNRHRNGTWIHPFEILTIGGDDVMLIVPADRALAIAKTLSEEFEKILLEKDPLLTVVSNSCEDRPQNVHRYKPDQSEVSRCRLSMSAGVLIAPLDMPVYYAENLTSQLLKSAKKKAKYLKNPKEKDKDYHGGKIDFLVMKSVTMLSSKIGEFRESGLIIDSKPKLKLYGAPYTLHEIGGLLETVKALKKADFPRSQLYQIRSFLERGKNTAMLNYRYFRARLSEGKQTLLETYFEKAWCQPQDSNNKGNLAPWMSLKENGSTTYETIWRELIDLYPFIHESEETHTVRAKANEEVR